MEFPGLLLFFVALAWDLVLGELPRWLHPVVGLGKIITGLERLAPGWGAWRQGLYGGLALLGITLLAAAGTWAIVAAVERVHSFLALGLGAYLLTSTFAVHELWRAALQVKANLEGASLAQAQASLRSLVSRPTTSLDAPLVVAATVESIAENLSDSIVAPLFWYLLLGLPGAVAYRVINTFDAMWGYRGRYEYLGKVCARVDDLANYLPARLTALLLVAAAFLTRKGAKDTWIILCRDHAKTASPNAGWPMSAAAGALGVRLEKPGHYALGDPQLPLSTAGIDGMLKLAAVVVVLWFVVSAMLLGIRDVLFF